MLIRLSTLALSAMLGLGLTAGTGQTAPVQLRLDPLALDRAAAPLVEIGYRDRGHRGRHHRNWSGHRWHGRHHARRHHFRGRHHWRPHHRAHRHLRRHHHGSHFPIHPFLGTGAFIDFYVPGPRYVPRHHYGVSGPTHVEWCYARYRSYRAWDNTFQPYYGARLRCVSPYY